MDHDAPPRTDPLAPIPSRRTKPSNKLSRDACRRLLHGSDSDSDFSVACSVIWSMDDADWPEAKILAALANPENEGGAWYRRRLAKGESKSRVDRQVRRQIERHRIKTANQPRRRPVEDRSDVIVASERVLGFAKSVLTGHTSGNDLACLEAVLSLCLTYCTLKPFVPIRDLKLLMGVGQKTAWAALTRLCEAGILEKAQVTSKVRCRTAYTPTRKALGWLPPKGEEKKRLRGTASSLRSAGGGTSVPLTLAESPGRDCWRHGHLTKSGWLIYQALGQDQQTAADLAAATGKHPSTVRKALKGLVEWGLAAQPEPGQWVQGQARPELVFGPTTGQGRRQAERVALEREGYQDHLDELRGHVEYRVTDDGREYRLDKRTGELSEVIRDGRRRIVWRLRLDDPPPVQVPRSHPEVAR